MAKRENAQSSKTGTKNGRKQIFSLAAPGALTVHLAGEFTQWEKTPVKMEKGAGGVWQTTVELEPGAHLYRFLVDGQWRDDPECSLRVPNPFGSQDAVRQVV